jgi:hypothetical protein
MQEKGVKDATHEKHSTHDNRATHKRHGIHEKHPVRVKVALVDATSGSDVGKTPER